MEIDEFELLKVLGKGSFGKVSDLIVFMTKSFTQISFSNYFAFKRSCRSVKRTQIESML